MTAIRDLISASISAADELENIYCDEGAALREACARAMVQTNPKTCSDERPCTPCFTDNGPCEGPSAQPVSAASDADMQVYQAIADGYARDTQPVGEVPMPGPTYLNAGFDGWGSPLRSAYSEDDVRTYGEQCRAAGYAAGLWGRGRQPVGEVPMPEAAAYLSENGLWCNEPLSLRDEPAFFSGEMQQYGDARHQQGYAAGVAASVAALVALKPQSGVNPDGTAWLLPISRQDCVEAVAALRGEVKP